MGISCYSKKGMTFRTFAEVIAFGVQFGKGWPATVDNHRLPIVPPHPFNGTYLVCLLGHQANRGAPSILYLAIGFLLPFLSLQGIDLSPPPIRIRLNWAKRASRAPLSSFQRTPDLGVATNIAYRQRKKMSFVCSSLLARDWLIGGEFKCHLNNRFLNHGYPVLLHRLTTAYSPEGFFAASVIELLKAIETVSAGAHQLAGTGHIV
jgi:hypothetical protein